MTLSTAYMRLVIAAHHTVPPGRSCWLASCAPFLLGQVSPRWLWGDAENGRAGD